MLLSFSRFFQPRAKPRERSATLVLREISRLSKKFLVSATFERNASPLLEYHFSFLRSVNYQCPELRAKNRKRLSSSKSISRLSRYELVDVMLLSQKKIFRYRKEKSKANTSARFLHRTFHDKRNCSRDSDFFL